MCRLGILKFFLNNYVSLNNFSLKKMEINCFILLSLYTIMKKNYNYYNNIFPNLESYIKSLCTDQS